MLQLLLALPYHSCCGVWVPACAGTTAGESLLHICGMLLPDERRLVEWRRKPEFSRIKVRHGSGRLSKTIIEGVARAAHGADGINLVVAVERLAQAPDMHVDRALINIDVRAPHPVEQLLAREDAAWPLHQELEQ